MQAIVVSKFGGIDVLRYQEVARPVPQDSEVLIRVEATSVNFADIKARYGKYHGAGQPPFIPGLDATGIVEEVGQNVTLFTKGQRVIAFPKQGSYADYALAEEVLTFAIPPELDIETAAASPLVSFTSYNLLMSCARLQPGECVLIHGGAGGIGTTAIQLAKILGAKKVFATVGSDAKIEVAKQAGADLVFNYKDQDFVSKIMEMTNNCGVDIILDSLGGEVFEKSLNCLARFGRIVNFGNADGAGRGGEVQTNQLHSSCRSVIGYSIGTTIRYNPHALRATAAAVIPFLATKQLQMVIGQRFPLQEAAQAHQLLESRTSTGKILLIP